MDAIKLQDLLVATGASTAEMKAAAETFGVEGLATFTRGQISDTMPPIVGAKEIAEGMDRRGMIKPYGERLVEAVQNVVARRFNQRPDAALLKAIRLIVREELAAAGLRQ